MPLDLKHQDLKISPKTINKYLDNKEYKVIFQCSCALR